MTQSPQRRPGRASLLLGVLILGMLAGSCSEDDKVAPPEPAPFFAFALVDVNVNSATYDQAVSTESFRGRPLVFYVGKAG